MNTTNVTRRKKTGDNNKIYFIQSLVSMSSMITGTMSYEYFTSYDAMRKRIDDIEQHEALYEIIDHGEAWIENDRLCPHA